MLSTIYSAGLFGIDGFLVSVECNAQNKIPSFELVGLPDLAVKEILSRARFVPYTLTRFDTSIIIYLTVCKIV